MRKTKPASRPSTPAYTPSPYAQYLPTPDDPLRECGRKAEALRAANAKVEETIQRLQHELDAARLEHKQLTRVGQLARMLPAPFKRELDADALLDLYVQLADDLDHLGWAATFYPDGLGALEVRGPKGE